MKSVITLAACMALTVAAHAAPESVAKPAPKEGDPATMKNPAVVIETSMGTITAELWPQHAPETVRNFLMYTDDSYYDDLIFHRVIDGVKINPAMLNDLFALHTDSFDLRVPKIFKLI